jgi:hypothetical protein
MRGLTEEKLAETMGKVVNKGEIKALLARRDAIVKLFDQYVTERGEAAVLYSLAAAN